MKLLIISHTAHYQKDGVIVGWGPTVREIDHLAQLFQSVVHIAPIHQGQAPASAIAYQSPQVTLRSILPSGGTELRAKLAILLRIPSYAWAIMAELRNADVVHVRCPANISLVAILILALARRPGLRWVKYAGNWHPGRRDPWSYRVQRWCLRKGIHRGVVTVNGDWPDQASHVYPFFNPCLTDEELAEGRALSIDKELTTPIRLLYVGRLEQAKGTYRIMQTVDILNARGVLVAVDLVGDGPERPALERQVTEMGIAHLARFHGWLPRTKLAPLYAQSHILLFPSDSEGWPKVLSEGMAYGVVPVSSNVSSIPQYLQRFQMGAACEPTDIECFVDAIAQYHLAPSVWKDESSRARDASAFFSYSNYLKAVRRVLQLDRVRERSAQ